MEAPDWLAELQAAFARSIRTPFDIQEDSYTLRMEEFDQELLASMLPRQELSAADRLAVYNQQYWFRLLTLLQKEYPLLRHLLGVTEFNRLCSSCLQRYPSTEPELHHLPEKLTRFLEGETPWSRVEFREAAQVDFAYFAAFFAEEREDLVSAALTPETTTALLTQPIPFHRGWRLIEESYNCVESRKLAAQDPEDQLQIQLRPQRAFWVVFRSSSGVTEEAVSPLQAEVLRRLARRVSLVEACEELENELDAGSLVILREQIQVWFQHWAELGWFCHPASA